MQAFGATAAPQLMNYPPMMGMMQSPFQIPQHQDQGAARKIEELTKKYNVLQDDFEQECKNTKLLEQKCEEYLSQLQRSADIIENTKNRHALQFEALEDKFADSQNALESEKERGMELEEENERLRNQISELRLAKGGDDNAIARISTQLEDKGMVIHDLKEQVE